LSETSRFIASLQSLSEKLVQMSSLLSTLTERLRTNELDLDHVANEITEIGKTFSLTFEQVAQEIMEAEFLNVNPSYLLDVARHMDLICSLIERCALLFSYARHIQEDEVFELVITATSELNQITIEFAECLKSVAGDRHRVMELCDSISKREKALKATSESLNMYATQEMTAYEYKPQLRELFDYYAQIRVLSRDLTITFRVLALKLERQRLLNVKAVRPT